MHSDKKNKTIP